MATIVFTGEILELAAEFGADGLLFGIVAFFGCREEGHCALLCSFFRFRRRLGLRRCSLGLETLAATAPLMRRSISAWVSCARCARCAVAHNLDRVAQQRAAESRAAEAKPSRAADPQNAGHQRRTGEGSKTLSETKAMRCGISSSRRESRAAWVRRSRSSSSRQGAQS